MTQIAIPVEVTPQEVSREGSLGGAIWTNSNRPATWY